MKSDQKNTIQKNGCDFEPTFMEVLLCAVKQYNENLSTKSPMKPRKLRIEHIPTVMEQLNIETKIVLEDLKSKFNDLLKNQSTKEDKPDFQKSFKESKSR